MEDSVHRTARHTRRLLLSIGLVVLASACAFPVQSTDSGGAVEGTYYVNGTDALGTEYGGRLEITPGDTPGTYAMQWIITGSVQLGEGTRNGSRFEATWSTIEGLVDREDAGLPHGTAAYRIAEDGALYGTKTVAGVDTAGTEEAFPVEP